MVYNTLKKIFLGSNHLLTITMATMIHPFQKCQNGQQQYEGIFCIRKHKEIWYNKKVKC